MAHPAPAVPRRRSGLALAAAMFALAAGTASAADFPQRPVRMVVPYAAGGGTDVVARALAAAMTAQLPQPVVVENRAGAGGMIGADSVARSAPDGHSILFTNTGHAVLRIVSPNANFDIQQALTPVTIVSEAPMIMMVSNNVPARDLHEFLALVRANPGRFDYGSTGTGGSNGMTAMMFVRAAGLAMSEVPYRGGAPATLDLVAGRIAMLWDASSTALQTVRGGQVRAMAVSTAQRSPSAPELPTLLEAGVPASMSIWMGIFVPSATPPALRDTLRTAIVNALQDANLRQRLTEFGTDRVPALSPEESARYVAAEVERWEALLRGTEPYAPPR